MKNSVLPVLILLVLSSCSKDSEEANTNHDGKWALIDAACQICSFDDNFDYGVNKVTFDSKKNSLTVENTGEISFFRESGTYNMLVNSDLITLEDNRSYRFEIKGPLLKLTYVDDPLLFDDESAYTYVKD